MSPGSSTESYPAFARIGLRETPGKNLNQVTCPDRDSNPGHLVSRPDALTVTPQVQRSARFAYKNMLQIIELFRITFQYKVRNCSYVTLTITTDRLALQRTMTTVQVTIIVKIISNFNYCYILPNSMDFINFLKLLSYFPFIFYGGLIGKMYV
ncbi:hypothetical protein ANN_20825 [Periplaneta americana]|uniref:Uncharacterized protein n=1 Tax=Periplaneta americana TaxID=6978 RepID=A0ABQ8SDQ4_PERAM|nr:hypothetical protein ANN_20825 [Periplaneta americana]